MVDFLEKHGEFVREMNRQTIKCQNERGKTEMFLKTILKAQNTLFSRLKQVTHKLPDQVAKNL